MRVLEISTAMDCPMRCGYCPQEKAVAAYHGPRLMAMDTFKSVLTNAGAVEVASFAGFSEPFINPRCIEMMRWTGMHGISMVLFTTGVGMVPAHVQALAALKPQRITLHLPDAQENMKISITPGYLAVIDALLQSKLDLHLMAMGDVHPAIVPLIGGEHVGGPESMQTRAGNVTHPGLLVQLPKKGPLKCGPAPELDHPVVLPSGEVVACCQDWALKHVLGNLARQTWDEIYTGQPFQSLRSAMAEGECLCRQCEYAVPA